MIATGKYSTNFKAETAKQPKEDIEKWSSIQRLHCHSVLHPLQSPQKKKVNKPGIECTGNDNAPLIAESGEIRKKGVDLEQNNSRVTQ